MNENILDSDLIEGENNLHFIDDLGSIERIYSMLLDHFIITMTIVIVMVMAYLIGVEVDMNATVFFLFFFVLYLNKDFLQARSPAKRMLGQVILDLKTNQPASELKCVIRNFTIIFWIFEILVVLLNPNRRMGDLIAGTRVVRTEEEPLKGMLIDLKKTKKMNWCLSIAVIIAYTLILGLIVKSLIMFL